MVGCHWLTVNQQRTVYNIIDKFAIYSETIKKNKKNGLLWIEWLLVRKPLSLPDSFHWLLKGASQANDTYRFWWY